MTGAVLDLARACVITTHRLGVIMHARAATPSLSPAIMHARATGTGCP